MKPILLKTWLILVCLLFGVGTGWAETYSGTFNKITTTDALTTGKYVIVGGTTTNAMGAYSTFWASTDLGSTINSGKTVITNPDATVVWDITKDGSNYIISQTSGGTTNYVGFTGTSNNNNSFGTTNTDNKTKFTASVSSGTFTFTNVNYTSRQLKYNSSSPRFSNYTGQTALTLFKLGSTAINYTVTIANNITNGTVTASATSAATGDIVTLTATPDTGYEFGSWNVTNASTSAAITVTNNKFTMPAANVNVNATFNQIQGGGDEPSGDGTTYNFADMTNFSTWDNGYGNKTTTFSDGAYAELASANKSTATITDCPVTKGGDVIFKAPEGKVITSLTFTCTQWTTKAQTITLNTSSDGTNYTATSTTSSNFVLSASNLTNVSAVKFTFSSTSNQVGIKSIKVTYEDASSKTTPSLSFANSTYNATMGEAFTAPTLTNSEGVTVSYTSSETGVATVNATTGEVYLVGAGITTITASYDGSESDTYNSNSASYQLVVAAAPAQKYEVTIETPENGTLTIKDGENVINSGDEVEEGTELTIEVEAADGYHFKNWGYKDGDAAWVGNNTTTFTHTMPSAPCSFKATFELIPTYTIAFSVNGAIVQSDVLKEDAAVTIPANPEAINSKVFTGWIETATVEGETPAYVTPATTAKKTVTYYAVFATQEGAAGGEVTEELTNAEVNSLSSTGALAYANETTYTDGTVDYSIYAYTDQANRKWIQVKKDQDVYIKMTAPSPIKNVEVTLTAPTNSSGGINDISKHTAYSGYVALCESDCSYTSSSASVASTNVITNNVATLEPTGDNNELYLNLNYS